jgi:hypothetical protein
MTFDASSMIGARATCAALVLASVVVFPSAARADAPPAGGTRADALFREGRALLDAKRYDEACPKLAESQKAEPGAGTLLALALCHEAQGKTATAWSELNEAAALGKRVGRAELASAAQKRATAMEPLLSRVVVRVPSGEQAAYDVICDGEPLDAKQLAAGVPVDPGEHRVAVSARGKVARSYVVRLTGAGAVEIVVDRLEDAPRAAAPVVARPSSPKIEVVTAAPSVPGEESKGGAQRTIGLVVVGLGVAGLGTGAYFGGRALSQSAEGRRACSTAPCRPETNDANERAKASFAMTVVSVAAGTGAIALGTIIYLMAPSAPRRGAAKSAPVTARITPELGPTQASLGLTGSF